MYESPSRADLTIEAGKHSIDQCVQKLVNLLISKVLDFLLFDHVTKFHLSSFRISRGGHKEIE